MAEDFVDREKALVQILRDWSITSEYFEKLARKALNKGVYLLTNDELTNLIDALGLQKNRPAMLFELYQNALGEWSERIQRSRFPIRDIHRQNNEKNTRDSVS
jgi:hypothetical protein